MNSVPDESRYVCDLLDEGGFSGEPVADVGALQRQLSNGIWLAVILDLDGIPVDNRTIRELVRRFPETCFFCMSRERYHPDLSEAIRHHFYACLFKPLDPDELLYLLRCAADNNPSVRSTP